MNYKRTIFFLLALQILTLSCYTKTEGCLDLEAVNFNPTVDKSCCCEYPSFILFAKSNWKDKGLKKDTFYQDGGGNLFKLTNVKYYISNIILVKEDNTEIRVTDTIQQPNSILIDDYRIINSDDLQLRIGKIKINGKLKMIKFKIGLDEIANATLPSTVLIGKGLAINKDSMFDVSTNKYIFNKITYTFDSIPKNISYSDISNTIDIQLPINFNSIKGKDLQLEMKVDYSLWFKNIDLKKDTLNLQIIKLIQNIPSSFSF
jgi:hypothetical protein